MERLRYSKNMAEGIAVEQENTTKGKISRRSLLGAAAAGIGLAAAASVERHTGVLSKTADIFGRAIEGLLNRQTEDQRRAAEELNKESLPRLNFRVKDHPEYQFTGGLNARNEPRGDIKGEPPGIIAKLQPGDEIRGAINWKGKYPGNPNRPGVTDSWLAFKDKSGRVIFVVHDDKYLEKIEDSQTK